jgi:hypothetical protein
MGVFNRGAKIQIKLKKIEKHVERLVEIPIFAV